MKIGDDWFTKSMLINTLYGNQKIQSQIGLANTEFNSLFSSILNHLVTQTEVQSFIPEKGIADLPLENNHFQWNDGEPKVMTDEKLTNPKELYRYQTISADKLNQELGGKLQGMGQAFVNAGKVFNVDPALLAAIAQHETGNGKSRAAVEKNNIAGMMGINGLKSYASVEESIMDMARNISKNYIGNGLSSIAKIGAKYAPIGAANDPTGLNHHWITGVTKYFNKFSV